MSIDVPHGVTLLLEAAARGDSSASAELLPLVYEELRKLAHSRMKHERDAQTLQPTALVHEAYLRLLGSSGGTLHWDSRGHFFGAAALAMRRILIERARQRASAKHGGEHQRVALEDAALTDEPVAEDLLALDEALQKLERVDPRKAQIVMLRYFGGLSIEDVAHAVGVSAATVKTDWGFARAWLHREMSRADT